MKPLMRHTKLKSCGKLSAIMSYLVFVATLPYSGYAYVEAFFSMNQECWTAAHVNTYKYFGGVTRILQCDNLKTGLITHGRSEVTLNKSYNDFAEHYGTLHYLAVYFPKRIRQWYCLYAQVSRSIS